ncbi:hypothetical protein CXT76_01610 [Candidatus Parvarchaeota archaeon]|jgi:hypothetical protein|nr:MAG: hypothetical protein CXT76_01610 [Candidatus Parvarchaeota archaeon]HIG52093.1 hypothetical protein [Candidatus Pacearchaeota archaeon]
MFSKELNGRDLGRKNWGLDVLLKSLDEKGFDLSVDSFIYWGKLFELRRHSKVIDVYSHDSPPILKGNSLYHTIVTKNNVDSSEARDLLKSVGINQKPMAKRDYDDKNPKTIIVLNDKVYCYKMLEFISKESHDEFSINTRYYL